MENNSSSSGIGFVGFLQILFIALKLTDEIDWSWFYVLLPTIISVSIVLGISLVILILFIIATVRGRW